jgi:hypothetical protein
MCCLLLAFVAGCITQNSLQGNKDASTSFGLLIERLRGMAHLMSEVWFTSTNWLAWHLAMPARLSGF